MPTRLHGALKEASNEWLRIEDSSLYPARNRLPVKGWLAAEWDTSENEPKARFCRLTADCRKRLEPEAGEFQRLVQAIQLAMKPA